MGRNSRRIKERAIEFEDEYEDAMLTELKDQMTDYINSEGVDGIDTDEIEEIVVKWKDALPDVNDWCWDQVNNELADIGDMKYDQMRDEQMEREHD